MVRLPYELSGEEFVWLSIYRTSRSIHGDLNFGLLPFHRTKYVTGLS